MLHFILGLLFGFFLATGIGVYLNMKGYNPQ